MASPGAKLRLVSTLLLCAGALSFASRNACGQTVSPDLFSGLRWRLIGPFRGGRTVAVTGVPGSSLTFYFGAVDGGVWKTTNAGTVWTPVFDDQPIGSIGAIAAAPSDPDVLYTGSGESDIRSDLASGDGVYKSTDGGKTWRNVGLKDSRQISRIVIDPHNPDVVYVGALGHAYGPNEERGVYKSTDGGATWKHVLDKGPDVGASDLAIASGKPEVLFAGMWNAHRPPWSAYPPIAGPGSGLYRSSDGGATWTQLIGHGLPAGDWGRVGVTVSPDGQRVYAVIEAKPSGLYRSDDGGDTWTLANSDPRLTSRAWYFNSVTIDPQHPDVVYVPNVALYRSQDAGKTISIVRGAPGGDDYHQLWVDPKNSSTLLLASDQGTTISLDYGKTWSSWYNQPTAQLYHVITDNEFPYVVYGAQQDTGSAAVFSRTDHGQITPRDWFPAGETESGYFAPDPNDPNILYETQAYGGVARFNRRTSFTQDVSPWPLNAFETPIFRRKYRATWTPVLIFSPLDKKTLYLGTQFVMATTDGGLHWQTISPDLTGTVAGAAKQAVAAPPPLEKAKEEGYGVIFSIAPSPLKAGEIWAGSDTGLIHLSLDGGEHWKDVTPEGLGAWSKISLLEASHFDPGEAYAAVDRHRLDDYQPYIYRTRDFGKTWQRVETGIPQTSFLRAVREDPKKKGLLFAGTESGVYFSLDDGDHWQSLQLNLPTTSIRDLVIHDDDLVIATHGRSFWILDDIVPLRQIDASTSSQAVCFFQPAATIRVDNDSFPGTPLPPEEPTAKNPADGAILDYVLPSTAGEVSLEISDQHGQLVRRFTSRDTESVKHPPLPIAARWFPEPQRITEGAGMHRFVWDLRARSSGVPFGDEDNPAGDPPRGPRVPPGTYQVKLSANGQSFTRSLVVTMDPRAGAPSSVLDEQYRLGLEIFEQTLQTRGALAEVDSVQSHVKDLQKGNAVNNSRLMAQLNDLEGAIQIILHGDSPQPGGIAGLADANSGLSSALKVVEGGDRTIPAQALDLYQQAKEVAAQALARWANVKSTKLAALNDALKKNRLPAIQISEIEEEVEVLKTR